MGKNINEKSHGNYKGNLHVTFFRSKPVIPLILFPSLLAIPIMGAFLFERRITFANTQNIH